MRFTQHPTNNHVLGAPQGWDQQQMPCNALPVTAQVVEGDHMQLLSFWRPSAAEREAIAAGALVVLSVFSTVHPPVWVGVEGVPE